MIQPIRPVGWSIASCPGAIELQRARLYWSRCLSRAIWLPWIRWPLALRVYLAQAGLLPGSDPRQSCPPGKPQDTAPWQPWPAHGPFAHETARWWPSDDWPPVQPAVILEDHIPDIPPPVLDWRAAGSLLDFRV